MSAPVPRAAAYAAAVVLPSWGLGALMALLLLYVGGPADHTFRDDWLSPVALTVPATAFTVLLGFLLATAAGPRWRTAAIDTCAYAAVLLAVALVRAVSAGDEAPVDAGFVALIIALFTLPAGLALSAMLSEPLLADGPGRGRGRGMCPTRVG